MTTMMDAGYGMREFALNDMVMNCVTYNHGNAWHQHEGVFDAICQHAFADKDETLYVCGRESGHVDITPDRYSWMEDEAVNIVFACYYEDGLYHCRLLKQE